MNSAIFFGIVAAKLRFVQATILRQFNPRLKAELGISICAVAVLRGDVENADTSKPIENAAYLSSLFSLVLIERTVSGNLFPAPMQSSRANPAIARGRGFQSDGGKSVAARSVRA